MHVFGDWLFEVLGSDGLQFEEGQGFMRLHIFLRYW